MTMIMITGITTIMATPIPMTEMAAPTLMRLMTWLSPAFPVGGFSYSHGLEWHVETGLVRDRAALIAWITDILEFGAGRNDAILLLEAWAAAKAGDPARLEQVRELAVALNPSEERALENESQGNAFLKAVSAGWPQALPQGLAAPVPYPVAVGAVAALAGMARDDVLPAYLNAFTAFLISGAVRLVPLGQSDGLAAHAALEDAILALGAASLSRSLDDLGGFAVRADLASMHHETQYTRLFRS